MCVFWSEFTKNQLKNSLNEVIVKIVIYKNLKHNGKASEWPEGGV